MKSIDQISSELNNNLSFITSYEKTKLLVAIDRVLDKPYTNHRVDLNFYSIRYKTQDKTIYVYTKIQDFTDSFDFDCIDDIEFPIDFNVKISLNKSSENIIKSVSNKLSKVIKVCSMLLIWRI